jgi:hypothetical protein
MFLPNNVVDALIGVADVAANHCSSSRRLDLNENGVGIDDPGLHFKFGEINRATVQPWRRSGLAGGPSKAKAPNTVRKLIEAGSPLRPA